LEIKDIHHTIPPSIGTRQRQYVLLQPHNETPKAFTKPHQTYSTNIYRLYVLKLDKFF